MHGVHAVVFRARFAARHVSRLGRFFCVLSRLMSLAYQKGKLRSIRRKIYAKSLARYSPKYIRVLRYLSMRIAVPLTALAVRRIPPYLLTQHWLVPLFLAEAEGLHTRHDYIMHGVHAVMFRARFAARHVSRLGRFFCVLSRLMSLAYQKGKLRSIRRKIYAKSLARYFPNGTRYSVADNVRPVLPFNMVSQSVQKI